MTLISNKSFNSMTNELQISLQNCARGKQEDTECMFQALCNNGEVHGLNKGRKQDYWPAR